MQQEHYNGKYLHLEQHGNIVFATFLAEEVDFAVATTATKERQLFCQGKEPVPYLLLLDLCKVRHVSKPGRDHLASSQACHQLKAIAIVTNTMVGRTIVNFLLHVSRPPVPCQQFGEREKALAWLAKFT
ncbi:MAG: STAS/SEC14 domain-containing protein [Cytophagales bacterium]|nr:STAS/SEC14 domain-containing protein [Cytophagales bacterium]